MYLEIFVATCLIAAISLRRAGTGQLGSLLGPNIYHDILFRVGLYFRVQTKHTIFRVDTLGIFVRHCVGVCLCTLSTLGVVDP